MLQTCQSLQTLDSTLKWCLYFQLYNLTLRRQVWVSVIHLIVWIGDFACFNYSHGCLFGWLLIKVQYKVAYRSMEVAISYSHTYPDPTPPLFTALLYLEILEKISRIWYNWQVQWKIATLKLQCALSWFNKQQSKQFSPLIPMLT